MCLPVSVCIWLYIMTSIKSGKTRAEGEEVEEEEVEEGCEETPDILGQSGPSCSEQCKLAESLPCVTASQVVEFYSNLGLTLMAGDWTVELPDRWPTTPDWRLLNLLLFRRPVSSDWDWDYTGRTGATPGLDCGGRVWV